MGGWVPRAREECGWVVPAVEEAKRIREEQGQMVLEFVRGFIAEFGSRWGQGERGRMRGELRGFGGG